MKKFNLTLFFIIISMIFSFELSAKKPTAIELLSTIDGQWQLESNNVFVQKVIELENQNQNAIYNKVQEFLARTYKDANEVMQVEDKDAGLLVGKGNTSYYVSEIFAGSAVKYTAWHIFKAEIKDNRLRITISINTINWHSPASNAAGVYISAKDGDYSITTCYPLSEDKSKKKHSGYVFYYAVNSIVDLMNECEGYLTTSQEVSSSDDW